MNIFFDTEFTGLVPNTTLISLGMVAENGATFYAEFTDYNKNLCDEWIKENVINNLIFDRPLISMRTENKDYEICSNTDDVVFWLKEWLRQFEDQRIQLISDVCHYDMTLFCNLFGGAFSLPDNINPVCYDICQDIAVAWTAMDKSMIQRTVCPLSRRMWLGFDKSREELCTEREIELPNGKKHNALYDAKVIKVIFDYLSNYIVLERSDL